MLVAHLSDSLAERLHALAIPFTHESVESVIERIVSIAEQQRKAASTPSAAPAPAPKRSAPPAVDVPLTLPARNSKLFTWTKMVEGKISGTPVSDEELDWNPFMRKLMHLVYQAHGYEKVKLHIPAPMREGRKEDAKGWKYFPELSCSFQGVDSNTAVRSIHEAAKLLQIPVEVVFKWDDRSEAEHPGKIGAFSING